MNAFTVKVLPVPIFLFLVALSARAFSAGHTVMGVVVAVVAVVFAISSIGDVPIAQEAELTWFGRRLGVFVGEGKFLIPQMLFFSYVVIDVRDKVVKLEQVLVRTSDNVEVEIPEIGLVYYIKDGDRFQDLDPEHFNTLLDDIVDVNIKSRVRHTPLKEAVNMELSTGEVDATNSLEPWGVGIRKIMVPHTPRPLDAKVLAALPLAAAEMLEAEGDTVEIENVIKQIARLMAAGETREQAIDQVQVSINHAGKNINVQQIMTSPGADTKLGLFLGEQK